MSLVLAALAVASAASADTKQFNFTVSPTQTTFTSTVALGQFNPTLGTLTSVTFGFANTMTSTVSMGNLSSSSTNDLVGTTNGSFALRTADDTTTYLADSLTSKAGTGSNGQGTFAIRPSGTVGNFYASPYGGVFAPTVIGSTVTTTLTNPALFAPFLGTASLNYHYYATALGTTTATGPSGSSNGNFIDNYVTNASATGYVLYTYTPNPVPEPASVAAFGIGALALVRRRKGGQK